MVHPGLLEGEQPQAADQAYRRGELDDATRLAYAEVLPDEKGATAAASCAARRLARGNGVTVERVLSDNGSCYRFQLHAQTCAELGMRHLFTRPYRPRTNGKAERFIQTLTNRWAYERSIYGSSTERTTALSGWLDHYNFRRRHGSLAIDRPRLGSPSWDNVLSNYS